MTKPLPFTKAAISRAIVHAQEHGATAVSISPDGSITLEEPNERPQEILSDGEIYVIEAGEFVKIGFSANPRARMRELQTANPQELKLVRTISGNLLNEALLHARFDDQSVRGEWFRREGALAEWIEQGCPL